MSRWVRNTVCPKCRERGADRRGNNLAEYDDGHKRCWSCKYYEPPDKSLHSLFKEPTKMAMRVVSGAEFPSDAVLLEDASEASPAFIWLVSYGITTEEIKRLKMMWSPSKQWLIFPIFSVDGAVVAWQARVFKGDKKYINSPNIHKHVFIEGWEYYADDTQNICVVEDVLSTIKVGRIMPCLCLFGSALLPSHMSLLMEAADKVIFWLDFDKYIVSEEYARKMSGLHQRVAVVLTKLDPKSYTTDEITDILHIHRDT